MIEKVILDYLNENLDVPVYTEEPLEDMKEYVLIEKTGSSVENFIESATITLQSYAETLYGAAELNDRVKDAMADIIVLDEISKCKKNNDYNFTDTTKKQYRYQAVYDLVFFN